MCPEGPLDTTSTVVTVESVELGDGLTRPPVRISVSFENHADDSTDGYLWLDCTYRQIGKRQDLFISQRCG
jgi:hypothetical protein